MQPVELILAIALVAYCVNEVVKGIKG